MRFVDCKIQQVFTSNNHPRSCNVCAECDLLARQFLVTVLDLIRDATNS